jgi:hypothetical protein
MDVTTLDPRPIAGADFAFNTKCSLLSGSLTELLVFSGEQRMLNFNSV